MDDFIRFQDSIAEAQRYPLNLSLRVSNIGALQEYKVLLDLNAPKLFNDESSIAVLRLNADGSQATFARE